MGAVGLVLVVVLFVVLSGGDDSGDSAQDEQTTQAASPSGGYGNPSPPQSQAPQDEPPKPEKAEVPDVPVVEIKDGEPVGGVQEIEFESGSEASFEVRSDAADELHFHGYDAYIDVAPGKSSKYEFKADIEGLFELESHTTGVVMAEISVVPG